MFFVVLLLIWGANLGIIKNLDRTFFKVPVFSHKEQDIFMDIFMQSRLSCGAKCTELFSHCSSFAWNEVETRCLLLASIFNLLFHNSSTQIGDNWEYYHLKGIAIYCHIYIFLRILQENMTSIWDTNTIYFRYWKGYNQAAI